MGIINDFVKFLENDANISKLLTFEKSFVKIRRSRCMTEELLDGGRLTKR